jgi:hypothetical protein
VIVVIGDGAKEIFGVEQRLFDQMKDMCIFRHVEHVVSIPAGPHEPGGTQFRQLLGHGRDTDTDVSGQLANGMLAVQERPDDPQAGLVAQQLEGLDGKGELLISRLRRRVLLLN